MTLNVWGLTLKKSRPGKYRGGIVNHVIEQSRYRTFCFSYDVSFRNRSHVGKARVNFPLPRIHTTTLWRTMKM